MRVYRPLMSFVNVALLLIGALCVAPSRALAETRSLSQQLRDAAGGQPVLIVNRISGGVAARSPDGSFHQLLVPDRQAIAYDPALELLWLSDGKSLSVLDLRLPQAAPVPILEHGPRERPIHVLRTGQRSWPGVYLRWTRQPRVFVEKQTAASLAPNGNVPPDEIAEANAALAREAGEVRIVGREWLVKNFDRRVRKTSQRRQRFDRRVRAAPLESCKGTCGRAARPGKANLLWVVTGTDHDDGWISCDLFDPGSRLWSYPQEIGSRTWRKETTELNAGPSCTPTFDASESAYLMGEHVCGIRSGCIELREEHARGWLDPGVELVLPSLEARAPSSGDRE
jgi:hypothetical protein